MATARALAHSAATSVVIEEERSDLAEREKCPPQNANGTSELRRKRLEGSKKTPNERGRSKWLLLLTVLLTSLLTIYILVLNHLGLLSDRKKLLNLCRAGLAWYQKELIFRPLTTRAVTAGIIFFLADSSAQRAKGDSFKLDRVVKYSSFGFFFTGPFLYLWYTLTRLYGPPDTFIGSVQKALFEQITMEPTCIGAYIVYDGVLERKHPKTILKRLQSEVPSLWTKNAIFWLPCNFANYYIGTPELRVIFANTCSFFWNVYFSTIVNRVAPKLSRPKSTKLEDGENQHKS